MAMAEKQLGQLRPANTTAASLYSPGADTTTLVTTIIICNSTATAAAARVFHDNDGTTYDQSTALVYDINIAGNTTEVVSLGKYVAMDNSSGNLAVRTDTANALTFTAYGVEIT